MFIDKIRHTIILKASFLIFSFTLLATIIRPLMIEQSVVFTYIGFINSFLMGCLFLYLKYTKPKPWHAMLFTLLGLLVLMPIVVLSGGVNSQFAFIFPIIPIFIALISNAKYTWITVAIIIFMLLVLFFSTSIFPDLTHEHVSPSKAAARALWLCLSIVLSAIFGIEFNRINSKLGNKLEKQAKIDPLTMLNNRRSSMNFLQTSIDEARLINSYLSLMMIDIDHFKAVNDNFGHLAGDSCLKIVAQSIQQNIRNKSDLVGRFGGEEFMVVINDIDPQKAIDIANQIRTTIEQTPVLTSDATEINLTATIGICTLKGEAIPSIEHFIDLADQALYQGKKAGRNRVVAA